jgi:hypothetical protein
MSVILTKEHDFQSLGYGQRHAQPCFHCQGPCRYPFLHWTGEPELFICSACCRRTKSGLMADLVHVVATVDLHNLGYHDAVFVRENTASFKNKLSV